MPRPSLPPFLLLALVCLSGPAGAQEFTTRKAQSARRDLDKAQAAARKTYEGKATAAARAYLKELEQAKKAIMRAGDLDEARRIDAAIEWLAPIAQALEKGVADGLRLKDDHPLQSPDALTGQRRYQTAIEEAEQARQAARVSALGSYKKSLDAALQAVLKAAKDLDEAERINAAIRAADQELDGIAAESGWVAVFRSGHPEDWNTQRNEPERFAIPLSSAPEAIRYVRLKRLDTGEQVILPLERAALEQDAGEVAFGWNGARTVNEGGVHLGIHTTQWTLTWKDGGRIMIGARCSASGWGFGHKVHANDKQYCAWAGQEIPLTSFEVAVTNRELNEDEQGQLLGR